MENYKKAYALLVGQIDTALTLLDADDLAECRHVREILQNALLDAEEIFLEEESV